VLFVDYGSFECWVVWFVWFWPVSRLPYAGQLDLELVGLLHFCVICFHQIGMIALKKLRASLPFAARELRQNREYLCMFVLFLR
jgi:hypothetical protein